MSDHNMVNELMRAIPSIDELLMSEHTTILIDAYGRDLLTAMLRERVAAVRTKITRDGHDDGGLSAIEHIIASVAEALAAQMAPRLKPVFNLTGTVLHTNLGRAPLPSEAIAAMNAVAAGASNLEFDLKSGKRGDRDALVEDWICRLTGAEAATVVNNNAAAVLLLLNTLALRKEVPVSRGELVEIGGSFRIPEVMRRAGSKLVEVGTTNRTHLADFETALTGRTALVMKVHTSNYVVQGFTAAVRESDLAALCHTHEVPFVVDLGSGTLVDLTAYGLPKERTVAETIADGADLVTFSGDKLLGGPQCGIIAGRRDLVSRIKKNAMKRALRVDKLVLAGLGAVLRLYADPARLTERLPTLRLLTREQSDIQASAERMLPALVAALEDAATVQIVPCKSQVGSGAMPVDQLPSIALQVTLPQREDGTKTRGKGRALERLAARFRELPVPVIGRVSDGALLFDLRCLDNEAGFAEQLALLPSSGRTR